MKKTLKLGIISFLAGEIVTLFYKDQNFRNQFNNLKGFDKCKFLFTSLLDLNKKVFTDISSVDYKGKLNYIIDKIEEERKNIEDKINVIKDNIDSFKKEKVDMLITEWEEKLSSLKNTLLTKIDDSKIKTELEGKISNLISKIEDLKSKFYKNNN